MCLCLTVYDIMFKSLYECTTCMAGPKTAMNLHQDYFTWCTRSDPVEYLNKVGQSHKWAHGTADNEADDFDQKFKRNCRLFKYFPVFHVKVQGGGEGPVEDLLHGRCAVDHQPRSQP